MSHSRRGGGKPERVSDIAIAKLFKVPHQHNFTVFLFELFEGDQEARFQFLADAGGGRRQFVIGQLSHQIEAGLVRELR